MINKFRKKEICARISGKNRGTKSAGLFSFAAVCKRKLLLQTGTFAYDVILKIGIAVLRERILRDEGNEIFKIFKIAGNKIVKHRFLEFIF